MESLDVKRFIGCKVAKKGSLCEKSGPERGIY